MITLCKLEFPETDQEWIMIELACGINELACNIACSLEFYFEGTRFNEPPSFNKERKLFEAWIDEHIVVNRRMGDYIGQIKKGPSEFESEGYLFESGVHVFSVFDDIDWYHNDWLFHALKYAWECKHVQTN